MSWQSWGSYFASGFTIIGFLRMGFTSKRLRLQLLWPFRLKLGCLLVQSCHLYVGFHLGSTGSLFPRLWPHCCQPSHWAPRDPLRSWSMTSTPSRNDSTFLTPSFQGLTFHCAGCNVVLESVFRITAFSHLRLGVMSCRLCFSDMISDLFCFYAMGVFCTHQFLVHKNMKKNKIIVNISRRLLWFIYFPVQNMPRSGFLVVRV